MSELQTVIDAILKFRDERNWEQFHNSKDLALAISIEAAELNELFLWKNAEDVDEAKLKKELADILIYSLLLANKHGFDIQKIISDKIDENLSKYPITKARNSHKKYTEL